MKQKQPKKVAEKSESNLNNARVLQGALLFSNTQPTPTPTPIKPVYSVETDWTQGETLTSLVFHDYIQFDGNTFDSLGLTPYWSNSYVFRLTFNNYKAPVFIVQKSTTTESGTSFSNAEKLGIHKKLPQFFMFPENGQTAQSIFFTDESRSLSFYGEVGLSYNSPSDSKFNLYGTFYQYDTNLQQNEVTIWRMNPTQSQTISSSPPKGKLLIEVFKYE